MDHLAIFTFGVASISRLHKIIGLVCKRDLRKRLYSAKETYNFKESTHRSHPIGMHIDEKFANCRVNVESCKSLSQSRNKKKNRERATYVIYIHMCSYILKV